MKNILILQHEAHEGLGAWEPLFKSQGRQLHYRHLYRQELVPLDEELCAYDGIVIMGGSMSANDGDRLEFIQHELKMIPQAIELKIPILGVCLGSQLIAKALKSKVYPGKQKEIGWYPLKLGISSAKDKVFGALASPVMMFQWHGETFDLPSGAVALASSALYPNQAFRYTDRIYGLQFHCEMTDSMVRDWVDLGKDEMITAGLSPEKILDESHRHLPTLRHWAHQIAQNWLSLR
ncbi:MAG: gamma-glutamyl-gamma-aminobutyrate hydrolase family protein [Deltaproteobacteria bacterium]|nr:gamma-glutamyl-gamma-aminobutyrate hydrolase family protein [Deltaproteobacteria bacterium]